MGYRDLRGKDLALVLNAREKDRRRGFWFAVILAVLGSIGALLGFGGVLDFDLGLEGAQARFTNASPGIVLLFVALGVYYVSIRETQHTIEMYAERAGSEE